MSTPATTSAIQVGAVGRVVGGRDEGTSVRVLDDRAETGGYMILAWNDERGIDKWARDLAAVEAFFVASRWTVAWPAQQPDTPGR